MKNDITGMLKDILTDYTDELMEEVNKVLEETAQEAVDELEQTSPKSTGRKRSGKYSRSWAVKTERQRTFASAIAYNKQYQLTHLLENGHKIHNSERETKAIPHIGPANEKAQETAVKKIIELIRNMK